MQSILWYFRCHTISKFGFDYNSFIFNLILLQVLFLYLKYKISIENNLLFKKSLIWARISVKILLKIIIELTSFRNCRYFSECSK